MTVNHLSPHSSYDVFSKPKISNLITLPSFSPCLNLSALHPQVISLSMRLRRVTHCSGVWLVKKTASQFRVSIQPRLHSLTLDTQSLLQVTAPMLSSLLKSQFFQLVLSTVISNLAQLGAVEAAPHQCKMAVPSVTGEERPGCTLLSWSPWAVFAW